jgi:ubiquinone/menaquinone biosynthesis C-methylase UbiE
LDFSDNALRLCCLVNPKYHQVIHGDIRKIPMKNNYFDGIYNLGVLEHMEKKDINLALSEFYRVLKPKGKIIIFWPSKYSPSVIFLNSLHFLINRIFKQNVRLHPAEISLLESKEEARMIFKTAGFKVNYVYRGIRDLYTFIVIVAKK